MQPRIAVIGMGGSISTLGRHKLDLYEYGQFAKPLQVEDVLAMFSDVLVGFDVVPVPFRAVDSATADPALWLELNALISRATSPNESGFRAPAARMEKSSSRSALITLASVCNGRAERSRNDQENPNQNRTISAANVQRVLFANGFVHSRTSVTRTAGRPANRLVSARRVSIANFMVNRDCQRCYSSVLRHRERHVKAEAAHLGATLTDRISGVVYKTRFGSVPTHSRPG